MFSDMFFKLLLFILHCAFNIFEFCCDIWVYLKAHIFTLNKHKTSSDLPVRIKALKKVPVHLTILLGQEEPSYQDLAHLVLWSIACGISFISFYEHKGILKATESELQYEVEKQRQKSDHITWHSNRENFHTNGFSGRKLHAKVLSSRDGRRNIADICKHLCSTEEESANVNIELVDRHVHKHFEFPDPDLAVYCGKTFCLYGYPPWQMRVTEFLNLKSHHNLHVHNFIEILERYNKCEQRLGK